MPVIATMNRINHLRDKLRDIEQRLRAAYVDDLPVGTLVEYSQNGLITVEIIRNHGPHRCWVRNPQTKREYLLDYARIGAIVEPEYAQQRQSDAEQQRDTRPIAVGLYRDRTGNLIPPELPLCRDCATRGLAARVVEFVDVAPDGWHCVAEHGSSARGSALDLSAYAVVEPLPFDDSDRA